MGKRVAAYGVLIILGAAISLAYSRYSLRVGQPTKTPTYFNPSGEEGAKVENLELRDNFKEKVKTWLASQPPCPGIESREPRGPRGAAPSALTETYTVAIVAFDPQAFARSANHIACRDRIMPELVKTFRKDAKLAGIKQFQMIYKGANSNTKSVLMGEYGADVFGL